MDAQMREAFARDGYIVVKDVLSPSQLAELNGVFDERLRAARAAGTAGNLLRADSSGQPHEAAPKVVDRHGSAYSARYGSFWSKGYRDMIDNEVMLPIVTELLSDPTWGHCPPQVPEALRKRIRLDHDNIHWEPAAAEGRPPLRITQSGGKISGANALHGGPGNWHITCAFELKTVAPGAGGFGALPGSQKPAAWQRLSEMPGVGETVWRTQWCDSRWSRKHPGWDEGVPVHRVEGRAGDCILFTEKITHG
jgi:hypothetical protein